MFSFHKILYWLCLNFLMSFIRISECLDYDCSQASHQNLKYAVEVLEDLLIRKPYSDILNVIIPEKSLSSCSSFLLSDHFHSTINIKFKIPVYISQIDEEAREDVVESIEKLVVHVRKHFTLAVVWSASPEHFQFLEDHIINPFGIVDSQNLDIRWDRCFRIHKHLIPEAWNWTDVEKDLKSLKSRILDHYERSYNKLTSGTFFNYLSRHMMIVSIILNQLNVSICADSQPTGDDFEAEVEFAVNTIEDFNALSISSEVFYSSETFIVKFASTYLISGRRYGSLTILVGPLGLNVFLATIITAAVLIAVLWLLSKIKEPGISLDFVFSVVLRPILDQCEERRLPSLKAYFRLTLITWLFYCLLVTDTYRGELISHMMKGQNRVWKEKFKDIVDHDYKISNFGTLPGQLPKFEDVLKSEAVNSEKGERKDKFTKILDKLNTTRHFFAQFGEKQTEFLLKSVGTGELIIIGDVFMLETFSDATEFLLGSRFYEVSEEYVPKKIFWSIKRSPAQHSILLLLKRLRDSGILRLFKEQDDSINHAMVNAQFTFLFEKVLQSESGVITGGKRGRVETLKVEHVRAVLAILGLGIIVSFSVITIEILFQWCTTTRVRTIRKKLLQ